MQQEEISFVMGSIDGEALCASFEIKGNIPWAPYDANGNSTCNDPVVSLFIAVRNQYRNLVPLCIIPVRYGNTIKCTILRNSISSQNHKRDEKDEDFEKVVDRVIKDMKKYLKKWQKKEAEQYKVYYEISEYASCNEVTDSFIASLNLHKAPPVTESMLVDILKMFADGERETINNLFKVEEEKTKALLQ